MNGGLSEYDALVLASLETRGAAAWPSELMADINVARVLRRPTTTREVREALERLEGQKRTERLHIGTWQAR